MSIDFMETQPAGRRKPENLLAGAIDIAIRDAEIHGTDLIVKRNGTIEKLSPAAMKRRLAKSK